MQAAADATTTLRIGALVLCNDYRHPVVLAKELATIDVLSGGRVEAGVGAGWMTSDYDGAGITLDPPGTRIRRLAEALDVLEGLWGRRTATRCTASTTRSPRSTDCPSRCSGLGRRCCSAAAAERMLALAGQRADIVGINVALSKGVIDADAGSNGTAAATDQKVAWVREAAGDRIDDIELQVRVHLVLPTDDRAGAAEAFGPAFGLTPAEALDTPHALVGSTDEIVDSLLASRERWGISYIGLSLDAVDTMVPVVGRLAGT